MKHTLRATLAISMGAALLAGSVAPAIAAPVTVVPTAWATQPDLTIDSDGNRHVAWAVSGDDPGIWVGTDDTAWSVERVSDGPDYRPSIAVDSIFSRHVLYVREGDGIYLALDATGTWVSTRIRADAGIQLADMAMDDAGHHHVAFTTASRAPGLYYLTDASGSWVTTRIAASPWLHWPSITLDAAGRAHVAYASADPYTRGLHYATNAAAFPAWQDRRVTKPFPKVDVTPDIAVGGGSVFIVAGRAFEDTMGVVLVKLTGTTLVASELETPSPAPEWIGPPSIAWDAAHGPRFALRMYSDEFPGSDGMFTWDDGFGSPLPAPDGADDDLPAIAVDAAGGLALALRRWYPAPGVYVRGPSADPELLVAGSSRPYDAKITMNGSDPRIGYDRTATDDTDGIGVSTRSGETWTAERVLAEHGSFDLDGAYLATGRTWGSQAGGTWTWSAHGFEGDEVSLDIGPFGGPQALYRVPDPGSDGAGLRWRADLSERQVTYDPWVYDPEIAVNQAVPSVHLFWTREERILYTFATGGVVYAEGGEPVTTELSDAPAAVGLPGPMEGVALAYRRFSANPGIWVSASGPGDGSRISRSWADDRPSIAVDGAGALHVVWARLYWAASPGVYHATNASGSWVTQRLTTDADPWGATIALTGDGALRIAYTTPAGVRYLEQAAGTASWTPEPAPLDGTATSRDVHPVVGSAAGSALGRPGVAAVSREPVAGSPDGGTGTAHRLGSGATRR